jgi:surface protein
MKAQQVVKARFKTLLITIFLLFGLQTVSLAQNEFITTWETTLINQEITIPTFSGETYNYTVDWGDGVAVNNITGDATHTYATAGLYTVKISGTFPRIYFNSNSSVTRYRYIKSIEHWGTNSWTSMNSAFEGCSNIVNNADDVPDLSGVTDMSSMFKVGIDGSELGKGTATNWNSWDTSKVTNMSSLFYQAKNFNKDIGNWNTAKVTDMNRLFFSAIKFNQDISNWNTGEVTDMQSMFGSARLFNQNIGTWNTAKVTNMKFMFFRANNFNGTIDSWNTASVTTMEFMFREAYVFNQSLNSWNTATVTTMEQMFYLAKVFNKDIGSWDTSAVTTMAGMFGHAYNFNQDIDTWNTSAVINMSAMFYKARDFNQSLNSWNTSKVTNMNSMFKDAPSFNGSIGNWDTSKVTYMVEMFRNAPKFNQDISTWNTSSLIGSGFMFFEAFAFNQNLSNWNMSNNTYMSNMFYGAMVFNQNISGWNTAKVTDMNSMFIGAIAFDQNVGTWNVSSVTKMTNMFNGVTLSKDNYDALLIGWSAQTLKNNVTFSGGNSKYCSENAQNARTNIINTYGWTIHDLGLSVGCTVLSVNDYNLDKSIVLYPNAVKEVLTIKSDNLLQKIILRDINGRVIVQVLLDNQKEKTISVSTFASGIYFAKIISDKGQLVKKIIKQ